jgi:5,5'-dehydrodivanillate O-demethylase
MYRVPMDETHTLHITYNTYAPPPEVSAAQDKVPYYTIPPSVTDDLRPIWEELDYNGGQDMMIAEAQGPLVDRSLERLGETDRGVIMWRDLLKRQLKIVEDGVVPMNVFHDPAQNERIDVPPRVAPFPYPGDKGGYMGRANASWVHSQIVSELVESRRGPEAIGRPVH